MAHSLRIQEPFRVYRNSAKCHQNNESCTQIMKVYIFEDKYMTISHMKCVVIFYIVFKVHEIERKKKCLSSINQISTQLLNSSSLRFQHWIYFVTLPHIFVSSQFPLKSVLDRKCFFFSLFNSLSISKHVGSLLTLPKTVCYLC